jgi:hypothetical protein
MRRGRIKKGEAVPFTIISCGLQLFLSAYVANGNTFTSSHLRDLFSLSRRTDKELNWAIEPGDPNQVDDKLIMMVIGVTIDAIMGLIETKRL